MCAFPPFRQKKREDGARGILRHSALSAHILVQFGVNDARI